MQLVKKVIGSLPKIPTSPFIARPPRPLVRHDDLVILPCRIIRHNQLSFARSQEEYQFVGIQVQTIEKVQVI